MEKLIRRIKAAILAFRDPDVVELGMPSEILNMMAAHGELASIRAVWVGDRLVPEVRCMTPKQSHDVQKYLDGY